MNRKTQWAYGALAAVWGVIVLWQGMEHTRVRTSARAEVINHAKDVSTTLGVVLRSLRRFGGIPKDRLESTLKSLVRPGELEAIALLNSAEEVVAAAGSDIDVEPKRLASSGVHWAGQTVTLVNLVDLGTNMTTEMDYSRPTIVIPAGQRGPFPMGRPPAGTNAVGATNNLGESNPPQPPPMDRFEPPPPEAGGFSSTNSRPDRPRRGDRPFFGRPSWMSETDYKSMLEKQGVHSFLVVLSTQNLATALQRDLWIRCIIVLLGGVAVLGLGLAWTNLARSSELEVRLARAAELNTRLKEMNLAAAGLAHETRNPLNIVRGLAQMIAKEHILPAETRTRALDIVDETDRVTAQLNEFINYSRPREVRRTRVLLSNALAEVVRTLGSDLEEKGIGVQIHCDLPPVEADDQLLRQALFNLLLNAVQAVEKGGAIQVVGERSGPNQVSLEIRDDGPGVAPENVTELFRPYFTTRPGGTGLGLAVVHQIILAHGWEIECLPNQPHGAVFRISHMVLCAK